MDRARRAAPSPARRVAPSPKRLAIAACAAAGLLGIVLRLTDLDVSPRTPDELVYTLEATRIEQGGMAAGRALVAQYDASAAMWVYPPPIRVGYLYLVAEIMKVTYSGDPRLLTLVSCVSSILTLAAVGWIGLRFFGPWQTFVALLLMSVSPLDLAMARRAWQDSFLGCVALWMVALCLETQRDGPRTSRLLPLWILGVYCMLVKESGIVLYGLCFLWLLWIFWIRQMPLKHGLLLALGAGIGMASSVGLMAYASGGLRPAADVIRHNMGSVEHNAYALAYQSGRWTSFAEGLWMLSPLATLLGVLGMVAVTLRRGMAPGTARAGIAMTLLLLAFVTIAAIPRHLHNLRYISPVSGTFFVLAGIGAGWLASGVGAALKPRTRPLATALALAGLLAVAFADYRNFREIFLIHGVPDLSNKRMYAYSIYSPVSPAP